MFEQSKNAFVLTQGTYNPDISRGRNRKVIHIKRTRGFDRQQLFSRNLLLEQLRAFARVFCPWFAATTLTRMFELLQDSRFLQAFAELCNRLYINVNGVACWITRDKILNLNIKSSGGM